MTSAVRAPRPTPRRAATAVAAPARPSTRRAELYVVGPPRRRPHTGAVLAVAVVIVFGSLLASAVLHSLLVSGQAHLDDVEARTRVEREQLQREELRLAAYQSPERIAREARRLGMVPADRQTWISPVAGAEPVVTGSEHDPAAAASGTSSGSPTAGTAAAGGSTSASTTPAGGADSGTRGDAR